MDPGLILWLTNEIKNMKQRIGLFQRVVLNRGKVRPDMAEGCPERFDWDFVKFIWNFNKNNRVLNATRIAKSKHAKAIVLKSRKEKRAFLESLS